MNAWLLAIRPKTLTAALIPVVVGTSLAWKHGSADWMLALCCLLSALSIQIATNLINDALDFNKGVDTQKRVGPIRVAQQGLLSPTQVMLGGGFFLALAILFGLPLVLKGGFFISLLLGLSVLLAYLYTGGPYPLSYLGVGELFVFLFFGLVGTCGTYYIQTMHLSAQSLLVGTQVGLLATLIMALNNTRDYYTDLEAQKRTIVVRLGITFGKRLISFCALFPYLLLNTLLPWLTFPLAFVIVRRVWALEPGKEFNQVFGLGALLHLSFGLALATGI